jgi:hypothetical protein
VAVDLVEHEAKARGEFAAERGLEHRLAGVALTVESTGVEGSATSVGTFGDVEDGPVEVDAGVAEAAGPMEEDRAHEAISRFLLDAAVTSAHETSGALQVALDLVPGGVERVFDLLRVILGAQRPDQRHRLRRREGEIEAGDVSAMEGDG